MGDPLSNFMEDYNNQKGYIALISVVFVSALLMLVVTSVNLTSISEIDMALKTTQAAESFYLAQACAEEVLMRLKEDAQYTGNESLEIEGAVCEVLSIEGEGNTNRTVKVFSVENDMYCRIRIEITQINPLMQITSWEEVESF